MFAYYRHCESGKSHKEIYRMLGMYAFIVFGGNVVSRHVKQLGLYWFKCWVYWCCLRPNICNIQTNINNYGLIIAVLIHSPISITVAVILPLWWFCLLLLSFFFATVRAHIWKAFFVFFLFLFFLLLHVCLYSERRATVSWQYEILVGVWSSTPESRLAKAIANIANLLCMVTQRDWCETGENYWRLSLNIPVFYLIFIKGWYDKLNIYSDILLCRNP